MSIISSMWQFKSPERNNRKMDMNHTVQYQFNMSFNQDELTALHDLITVNDLPEAFKSTHNSISNSVDTYKRAMDASLAAFQKEIIGDAGMSAVLDSHHGATLGSDEIKELASKDSSGKG